LLSPRPTPNLVDHPSSCPLLLIQYIRGCPQCNQTVWNRFTQQITNHVNYLALDLRSTSGCGSVGGSVAFYTRCKVTEIVSASVTWRGWERETSEGSFREISLCPWKWQRNVKVLQIQPAKQNKADSKYVDFDYKKSQRR